MAMPRLVFAKQLFGNPPINYVDYKRRYLIRPLIILSTLIYCNSKSIEIGEGVLW